MCLSVIRVLARTGIWQSASATLGDTQGTCALDFALCSAPAPPEEPKGWRYIRVHLTLLGAPPPAPPERELCFSCECANIGAAPMDAV